MDEIWSKRFGDWCSEEQENHEVKKFTSYSEREQMHKIIIDEISKGGNPIKGKPVDYMEFGVRGGTSFRWWVNKNSNVFSKFYGFDSFHGLPEEWQSSGRLCAKGDLTTFGHIPNICDPRINWYAGWFNETIKPFFTKYARRGNVPLVVHLDCDLYSSSVEVMDAVKGLLRCGDYIIMDDAGTGEEYRAYHESKVSGQLIAVAGSACAVKII